MTEKLQEAKAKFGEAYAVKQEMKDGIFMMLKKYDSDRAEINDDRTLSDEAKHEDKNGLRKHYIEKTDEYYQSQREKYEKALISARTTAELELSKKPAEPSEQDRQLHDHAFGEIKLGIAFTGHRDYLALKDYVDSLPTKYSEHQLQYFAADVLSYVATLVEGSDMDKVRQMRPLYDKLQKMKEGPYASDAKQIIEGANSMLKSSVVDPTYAQAVQQKLNYKFK
ncbi:hypothetical protein FLK61_35375 [Paenalkalicoccus suaedae]|uniref:Uncharacterized protein n=1 Tax=Paenalkalicoccus suaedae TaxID=2592382 RepID=A0A859FG10_9BACI|nr:hypothetical protein [Paenalkalicoccus suaedae]QKS71951.1 hypothetical protein FLK61_35375 [Paenalkalicoccus suaedae]